MDDSKSAWNLRRCSLVKLILASADVEINFFFGPKVDDGVSAWFLITPKATLWSVVWTNYQFFNVWNFVSTRTSQFCYKVIVSLVDLLQQAFLFLLYHWLVCQTCDFCNTANPAIAIGWGKQILWSPWIIIIHFRNKMMSIALDFLVQFPVTVNAKSIGEVMIFDDVLLN